MVWNSKTAWRMPCATSGWYGRVGGDELRASGQGPHDRRHLVVVRATAGEAHQAIGPGPVGLTQRLHAHQDVGLGRAVGQVEAAAEAQRLGYGGEELVERRKPEKAQHLGQLVLGVRQIVGHLLLHSRRPQGRADDGGRQRRARAARRSRRRRRAVGRRPRSGPGRSPARAWARSCRWSGSRPPCRRRGPRRRRAGAGAPRPPRPADRRRGPSAFSSSRAARPMKSPLAQPTTQPSSACSGVMPGPSSCPCRGSPASRRRVSRAPSPAGSDPGLQNGRPEVPRRAPRAPRTRRRPRRCSPVPETTQRNALPARSGRRRIGALRPRRARPSARSARALGPCTAMTARSLGHVARRRWPPPPGWCSRRWA